MEKNEFFFGPGLSAMKRYRIVAFSYEHGKKKFKNK
jgi:hypothetical protein